MSLIQTTALDLWGFKNTDIDSRILDYKDNFCEHFLRLFHQSKVWAEERPVGIGLQNYDVFRNTYLQHKEITYNSKNIVFETCVSDISFVSRIHSFKLLKLHKKKATQFVKWTKDLLLN